MTDFVNGLKSLSGNRLITPEASDFLYDAAEEMERLRAMNCPYRNPDCPKCNPPGERTTPGTTND